MALRVITMAAALMRGAVGLQGYGLWVCEPQIRSILTTGGASMSYEELVAKCLDNFPKEACNSVRGLLAEGPDLLSRLDSVCAGGSPAEQALRGAMVVRDENGTIIQYGPGVDTEKRLRQRAVDGPAVHDGEVSRLDASARGKKRSVHMHNRFTWEMRMNSRPDSMETAADSVRVFGAVAGSRVIEGTPTSEPRAIYFANVSTLSNPIALWNFTSHIVEPAGSVSPELAPSAALVSAANNASLNATNVSVAGLLRALAREQQVEAPPVNQPTIEEDAMNAIREGLARAAALKLRN